MKFKSIALGVVALSMAAFAATDAKAGFFTYDLIALIDGGGVYTGVGEKAVTSGSGGLAQGFAVKDTTGTASETVNMLAHGTNVNSSFSGSSLDTSPYAYLDRGGAGFGVCQVITSSAQCNPGNDDNVTGNISESGNSFREILSIGFTEDNIGISELYFRNDGHLPTLPTTGKVGIAKTSSMETLDENTVFTLFNFGAAGGGPTASAHDNNQLGNTLTDWLTLSAGFRDLNAGEFLHIRYENQQFYLSGLELYPVPIPVPAALPLFLSGLLGLGVMARRRKQKTSAA